MAKAGPVDATHNRVFKDERVPIDGRSFHDCAFENVTFLWNGELYDFQDCRLAGSITVETKNVIAANAITLLGWINSGGVKPQSSGAPQTPRPSNGVAMTMD